MTAWDEAVTGRGEVRPHWRPMLRALQALSPPALAGRAACLETMAWRLDPVPLVLAAAEWAALESGLQQRARLLEAVLADVYGEQSTLASGALPPALLFANPGFLRSCRGIGAVPGPFLHAYAADLLRSPDGEWRVLADRSGGAPGIGTLGVTRRMLAQTMPELFSHSPVRPLRRFFSCWREALRRLASPGGDRPASAAILGPGPADPHAPEHAALARELGLPLAEAQDLTARGGRLYMGPQPIDALLRRVLADGLDPLELAEPEAAGVLGLMDAARQGRLRILNHPGTAMIEAPALAAFMPGLCRQLLGEPLRLATLPSLWLADDGAKRTIASGYRRWAIRPAFDNSAASMPLAELTREERIALQDAVEAAPWRFVGCPVMAPSQAPSLGPDGLAPQPIMLRVFLIHDGQEWRAAPGGVARVLRPGAHAGAAPPPDDPLKDVWVLEDGERQSREPARPVGAAFSSKIKVDAA